MTVEINGLQLPASLLRAVDEGRWPSKVPAGAFVAVFRDEAPQPELYTLDSIRAINRRWAVEARPEFVGEPGQPGAIRPDRSLLIGELGPDQLVALSYVSEAEPSVVYLTESLPAVWVTVAANVDHLLARLDEAANSSN